MALQQAILVEGETSYPHYYLCNYLPLSTGIDPLSLSLLRFKRGRQPDLNAWIDCALETLEPPLIPPGSILLRALHHDETSVREDMPSSLDKLGKALADHFHTRYCPRFLRKTRSTQEIKGLSKEQRAAELKNRYYIDTRYLPAPHRPSNPPPSFLLIDDILTTGTTLQMIIAAILPSFPKARLTIFTLAKADYDPQGNQSSPLRNYDFLHRHSSPPTVAEEENYTSSPNILKARILADAWQKKRKE